jgi:hypothetical protein
MLAILLVFIFFFFLTMFSSHWGHDDIIYKYWGQRMPREEASKMTIFVLLKLAASLSGAFAIANLIRFLVLNQYVPDPEFTKDGAELFAVFSIFAAFAVVGAAQNALRLVEGRKTRPIVNLAIFAENRRRWRVFMTDLWKP